MEKYFLNHISHKYKYKIKSEINVTPFVDVMLVLLIIFMLTSHIIKNGIDVDLPNAQESFTPKSNHLNITIDKHSNIYIQEMMVKKSELVKKVQSVINEEPNVNVMIYGDKDVNYGNILGVFSILKQASIDNVTLVTEE
jgi:biopolymer transport protein TolR